MQSCCCSYYKAISQIFSNVLHHCLILWLPPISPFIHKTQDNYLLSNERCSKKYLWFTISFNGIRPGQSWFFYTLWFSHIPFARPADHNASPMKAPLLAETSHAIPLRLRVFVVVKGGPAYRIVSALFPTLMGASCLLAELALRDHGLLPASAQVSVLIPRVSKWPAKRMKFYAKA